MTESAFRIVVFSGALGYAVNKGIAELLRCQSDIEILIAEHAPRRRIKRLIRNQFRNLRRHGWRWLPYQAAEILSKYSRQPSAVAGARPGDEYTLGALLATGRVRHLRFASVNGEECCATVRAFGPDLGLSLAAPILRREAFAIPKLGTINLHKGRLPDYRGMPPAFWELWNDADAVGCTLHRVDNGLDTGDVLLTDSVPRRPYSTVRGLQLELDELGVELTCRAVVAVRNGQIVPSKQPAGGRTNRRPTLAQERHLGRRLYRLQPGLASRLRGLLKGIALFAYCHALCPVPRLLRGLAGRQRLVVLLYHRVNDDMRDSLTVGVEQFERQIKYLARHHTLVRAEDIIEGRLPRHSRRSIVAVTFDDGYLDNYTQAVPILLRHRVPAAFFVSTGIVNTQNPFPHDQEKLGGALPAMSWDNLRRMRDHGFMIGSHTVSHARLSAISDGEARDELVRSCEDLKRELGQDSRVIAYPYGGRGDIDAAKRDMITELGFRCCFSAYGGRNPPPAKVNLFDIRRVGVDYKFSMVAFKSRLEGWA